MNKIKLFTDGSVDTKLKIGYGAFLLIEGENLVISELKEMVKIKRFENTSSTRLELQTLLWALEELPNKSNRVTVFTDSQNIIGLLSRRIRLEKSDFKNKQDKLLKNHDLYRSFYQLVDTIPFELVKVAGHLPKSQKDKMAQLFTLVDKASRRALRGNN